MNGLQIVKIIGWGNAGGENGDYWIIENSWGNDWGIGGLAKVKMGSDAITIDQRVVAVTPNSGPAEKPE